MLTHNTVLHKKYHRLGVHAREVRSKLMFFNTIQERLLADILLVTGGDSFQILSLQCERVLMDMGFEINGFRYPMTIDLANLISRMGGHSLFRASATSPNPMTLNEAQAVLSKAYNGFPSPWEPLRLVHTYLMAEGTYPRMMTVDEKHPSVRRAFEILDLKPPSTPSEPPAPLPTPQDLPPAPVPKKTAAESTIPVLTSMVLPDPPPLKPQDPPPPVEPQELSPGAKEEDFDDLLIDLDDMVVAVADPAPVPDCVTRWLSMDEEKQLRSLLLIFGLSEPKVAKWNREVGNPFEGARSDVFSGVLENSVDSTGANTVSRKAVRIACGKVQGVGADDMKVGVLRGYAMDFLQHMS